MPTLANDVRRAGHRQDALPGQVAPVAAEDRYSARDELVDVDYEPRDPCRISRTALDPSAPVIRTDLREEHNHISTG